MAYFTHDNKKPAECIFYGKDHNGQKVLQDDRLEYQIHSDFLEKRYAAGYAAGGADIGGTILGLLVFIGVCFFIGCLV